MKTSDYESRCGNCHACGHNRETTVFGGDDSGFCPHCGKMPYRKLKEQY